MHREAKVRFPVHLVRKIQSPIDREAAFQQYPSYTQLTRPMQCSTRPLVRLKPANDSWRYLALRISQHSFQIGEVVQ